ncbi:MAG: DUF362 domain-containing protein [Candidatus Firestonebacteria bacterium]
MDKVIIKQIKNLKKDIADVLDELNFTPKHNEIIIKPNVLAYLKSGSGFITDVKIVRALVQVLLDKYDIEKIYVAESSYINADTKKSFLIAGYYELEKEFEKVKLVDLKDEKYEKSTFKINAPVILKNKTLIDVPVLKGHPQVAITCAVKNLKGLITDEDKKNIHKWGLEENLSLLDNFKPELVLVDATTVRETFGKLFPRKYEFNRIIGGKDSVFVDKVACDLVGLDITKISYLNSLWKDRKDDGQVIGFSKPLAKWNPIFKVINIGKIGINITNSCSRCWDNCLEAIRPGHIKRQTNVIKDIWQVLSSFTLKGKVNLIAGGNKDLIGSKEGRIILCGDCAIRKLGIEGAKIKGCPVDPVEIRKAIYGK